MIWKNRKSKNEQKKFKNEAGDVPGMFERLLNDLTTSPQQCDGCSRIAYLRPWGPNNSAICPWCAKKDPHGTVKRMAMVSHGMTEEEAEEYATFLLNLAPGLFDQVKEE